MGRCRVGVGAVEDGCIEGWRGRGMEGRGAVKVWGSMNLLTNCVHHAPGIHDVVVYYLAGLSVKARYSKVA